jgi:hypothetical protein
LREHVRAQLAGYKTPKRIVEATISLRAPNGKADYKARRISRIGHRWHSAEWGGRDALWHAPSRKIRSPIRQVCNGRETP